ncbi:MAG: peptidoglycan DD-metalloendopeptidase family protein, partial [Opitutaceae bacterium]
YGSLNSTYKWRWGRQHHGLDLGLHTGDSVMAAFDGVVRYAQFNKGGYGNCVIIRHLNGLETLYGHLSKLEVLPNQYVSGGQLIGLGGSTGHSMGPHLHFETRYKDFSFNPQIFIDVENQSLLNDTLVLSKSDFTANRYRSSSRKRQSEIVKKIDSEELKITSSSITASSVVTDADNIPTAEQNEISSKSTENIVSEEETNASSDNKKKEVVTFRHRSSYKKESKSYSRNHVRNHRKGKEEKIVKNNARATKTKYGRNSKDVAVKKKGKNEKNSAKNKPSYTIKKGDNLSSISKKTGIPVNKLRKSNNIKSDKKLKPGHKIRLHK